MKGDADMSEERESPESAPTLSLRLMLLDDLLAIAPDASVVCGVPAVDGALPPDFIIEGSVEALQRGEDPLWSSFFMFVDQDSGRAVGSGGFKSQPSEGRVEIGYGVAEACRCRGVATEATRRLTAIAFEHPEVAAVVVETAVDNPASRRVVEKAGFTWAGSAESEEDGPLDLWRLERGTE